MKQKRDSILQMLFSVLVVIICVSNPIFAFDSINQSVIERIGVQDPLEFNGTVFKLAWSANPNSQYYVQEYLPDGESLEAFNQMLTIHLFIVDIKPENAVQQQIRSLEERKKTIDLVTSYAVIKGPDGEYIIDFLVSESEGDFLTLVEFNIYRYKQISLNNELQALIVYTYSLRSYDEDILTFLESLANDRVDYLNQMILSEIPRVYIEADK